MSGVQADVLAVAVKKGRITPTEAGRIVHAHRAHICTCPTRWITADGWGVLNRLIAKGMMHHKRRGYYVPITE